MKKTVSIFAVLLSLLFTYSCNNDDFESVYDGKSSEDRRAEKIQEYKDILTGSEKGWVMLYRPNEYVGYYKVLVKFDKAGVVKTWSDVPTVMDDYSLYANATYVPKPGFYKETETSYRISSENSIDLVFEDHNVFHYIYSLASNNYLAEFEFYFKEATADKVVLESKADAGEGKTQVILVKATDADLSDVSRRYTGFDKLVSTYFTYKTPKGTKTLYTTDGRAIPGMYTDLEFRRVLSQIGAIGYIVDVDEATNSVIFDESKITIPLETTITTDRLSLTPPSSCNFTDPGLAGTYDVISNGTSTDAGAQPAVDYAGTVTLTKVGANYSFDDVFAGVYKYWYSQYGYTINTKRTLTLDKCGNLFASTYDSFFSSVYVTGKVNTDGSITLYWYNGFGDKCTAVYKKQ